MKCNLECPYAKPNGRDTEGNQSIICESRKWFMNELDDCIEKYDEKTITDLKNIWGIETTPIKRFRVFTEIPSNEKMIVDMITDEQFLTLDDICNLLNEKENENKQLKQQIKELEQGD